MKHKERKIKRKENIKKTSTKREGEINSRKDEERIEKRYRKMKYIDYL